MPYESFVMIKCDHGDVVQRVKDRGQKSEVRCQSAGSRPDIGCHIAKERTKLWDDHS